MVYKSVDHGKLCVDLLNWNTLLRRGKKEAFCYAGIVELRGWAKHAWKQEEAARVITSSARTIETACLKYAILCSFVLLI